MSEDPTLGLQFLYFKPPFCTSSIMVLVSSSPSNQGMGSFSGMNPAPVKLLKVLSKVLLFQLSADTDLIWPPQLSVTYV